MSMPEKQLQSPETIAWISYVWVMGLAAFGGVVSYLKKLQRGKKWKTIDFLIELVISAFAGLITFFICQSMHLSPTTTAAFAGISGHFSGSALKLYGNMFTKTVGKDGD
jgi:hypothetical protein